jgi:dynein heavy chain, axonemal
MFKETKP